MDFSLTPLLEASPAIQVHVVSALLAALTGLVIFIRRKGTRLHKLTGRVSVAAMGMVAMSGLFIHQIKLWGPFSPLHIFSLTTLAGLFYAIQTVRKGNVAGHEMTLKGIYMGGIVFAGMLTFSKGLVMHRIVFGESGGQFMPAPGELPGGLIVFALVGAIAIFVVLFLSGTRRPFGVSNSPNKGVSK